MARLPRIHFDGAVYHAMARGVDGRDVFMDSRDRFDFLQTMCRVEFESGASIIAYCLMGNHFHLAIKVAAVPLSVVMQRLLTDYVRGINIRYERKGHLFQERYKSVLCFDDRYLAQLVRYIEMNPVRAGLVLDPRGWPWSSRHDGLGFDDKDFDPWPRGTQETALLLRSASGVRSTLDSIGESVFGRSGVSAEELKSGSCIRTIVEAKRAFTRESVLAGHSLTAVAAWLNVTSGSASRYLRGKVKKWGT